MGLTVTHTNSSAGVPLKFLGGGVPPGSPNPDPISDPKNVILHTVFRLGLSEIMSLLLTLERQQKRFLKIHFEVAYISLFRLKLKR